MPLMARERCATSLAFGLRPCRAKERRQSAADDIPQILRAKMAARIILPGEV